MALKKTAQNEPETKRPDYIAYTVTEREGKDNFWTAIGAAWENKDGEGLSIRLTALPLDGEIVLRRPKDKE